VINPSLRAQMPFDTVNDLAAVTMTATSGILLSSSAKLPVNNVAELIAYGKANPGKLTYATPGAGSAMHLAGEQLKLVTGIQMLHVAYKGSGGAYVDVMDGRVDLLIDPLFASMPHLSGGKLRPLAIMSAKRDQAAPNIPAISETLPDFDVPSINGIVAPKGTPAALLDRISADFRAVLTAPAFKKRLAELGLEPVGSTPAQFDAYIRKEVKKWETVVRTANISIE
jgi:tripartite-type tricarboxylate transporter receptor subunit TctC